MSYWQDFLSAVQTCLINSKKIFRKISGLEPALSYFENKKIHKLLMYYSVR